MNITVPFALAGSIIVAAGPTIERLAAKPVVKIPDRMVTTTVIPKTVSDWPRAEPSRYTELWRDGLLNVPLNVPLRVLKVKVQDDGCTAGRKKVGRRCRRV
jgi:hypothetical protein